MSGLRDLISAYLRGCDGWREHPEHRHTYMQWEDLRVPADEPRKTLPTDLAAVRQLAYESAARSGGREGDGSSPIPGDPDEPF